MRRGRMAQARCVSLSRKSCCVSRNFGLNITVHCRRTASSSDMSGGWISFASTSTTLQERLRTTTRGTAQDESSDHLRLRRTSSCAIIPPIDTPKT